MKLSLKDHILEIMIDQTITSDDLFQTYHIGKKQRYFYYQNGFYVNQIPKKQNVLLYPNDIVTITMLDEKDDIPFDQEPIDICYEDNIILIINKPAYLLVHSDGKNTNHTLYNRVAYYYHQHNIHCKVRAIHRLDYETSGLIFFCKLAFFQPLFDYLLSEKKIYREYQAICSGILKKDITIHQRIGKDRHHSSKMRISSTGKDACTHVKVLSHHQNQTLIQCRLESGRTHQIRVHLASIHHPLVNDKLYGTSSHGRMLLHAFRLSFLHPISHEFQVIECSAPFK